MNPKHNPVNWTSSGVLMYPLYAAKEIDRMNLLNSFTWVKTEGSNDLGSEKYLDFLIGGTPIKITKGKVERYQIEIQKDDEKGNSILSSPSFEYHYEYPVIATQVCRDMMAARTVEDGVFINKINKPNEITKLKFLEPPKQNFNKTLAWRSDKEAIIAASSSKVIYIWDVNTQKCRNSARCYKKDITDLAWLNQKYFASASNGGKIHLWSINQPKPICGFTDSIDTNASTSISIAKGGSIDEAIILSGTDKVLTLWQKGTRSKIQFRGEHNSPITKVQCGGVACKERLFAALDDSGRIVLYDKKGKQSSYNNPDVEMKIHDFDCSKGFFGMISEKKYAIIWSPVSHRCLLKNPK